MNQKSKSLYSIVIENCDFNTRLHYSIVTNHICISSTFRYRKEYTKQYCENNKDKIRDKKKQYYINKHPNTPKFGSLEHRIQLSCTKQRISRDEWNGFAKPKYCNLWTEKFRESIRDQYYNKCYLCDKTTKRKLSVHHVNYNKNCLCGSSCEFVPLCQACHGKTNKNHQYWEDLIMNYLYPNRYFMVDL